MEYVMLKDVCAINMGQSPDSDSYNENGDGVPFFQGNADFGERYPVTRKWCSAPTKMAAPEDILISVRAPIGAMNYAKEDCCIGRGLAALTPDKTRVSPEFIFWLLKGKNSELNSKGTGSTFKAIGRKVLEETMVPDIPLEKQIEYSEALEKVYAVIQYRKSELQMLDDLIKARFVELFDGKYETVKLGDVIKTTSGGTPSKANPEYYEGGTIPWLTSGEVNAGVITSVKNYITEEGMRKSSAKMVPANSVVIAMYGATAGVTGILRVDTTTNQAVCSLLPTERYIPEYLYYAVASKKDWMISQCKGGGQPNISQGIIKDMDLVDAPLDEQKRFAEFAKQVDKSKFI